MDEKVEKINQRNSLIYQEDLRDRFGRILLPRKPYFELPGPGAYNELEMDKLKNANKKAFTIRPENKLEKTNASGDDNTPAPWSYNYELEPKQVSYHYWGNDNDK